MRVRGQNDGTVLHYAALHNTRALELLVERFKGSMLNIPDKNGNTPLHFAAKHNKSSLKFLIDKLPGEVQSLLKRKNKFSETVLDLAEMNQDSHKIMQNFLNDLKMKI